MSETSRRRGPLEAIAGAAALLGTVVAFHYASLGLTLSHYDARGHLVVARRIIDSITPGWQQTGAVWLPLPHLLNALPVQIDALYRTGASAVAISVCSFAVATAAVAWIVRRLTASWSAAIAAVCVFAFNPNMLYLQATPMTEPLLVALTVVSIALLLAYCDAIVSACAHASTPIDTRNLRRPSAAFAGWIFALACLTRYEAWPVTIGGLVASAWLLWRRGVSVRNAVRATMAVAVYPVAAILAFTIFSKIVVGAWFANGFFVPENPAQGHPFTAVTLIAWGLRELSGRWTLTIALIGAAVLTLRALFSPRHASAILPLALLGTAAVPWSAFVDGHPYRIRYMVPLVAVQAICAGVAAGSWRRGSLWLSAAVVLVAAVELHPLTATSPMVSEAQWDRPNIIARDAVTSCLTRDYAGESIMASMGSLGHYMQDLSRAGFSIRDFLHEGNGDIWLNALNTPRPYAGWILIEEKAEGGDMLAKLVRERPDFLAGYTRTCEAAGVALYRRAP